MKRLIIIVIGLTMLFLFPVWAQDIEKDELRLQVLDTEIAALRAAVERDNAQIGLLKERINRLNGEIRIRFEKANILRAEIQQMKDEEKAGDEKPKEEKKKKREKTRENR